MCIPFVCCSILALLLSHAGTVAHVIGNWEYIITEQAAENGEVREELQFRRDGSFMQTLRLQSHGTYKVAANHLNCTFYSKSGFLSEDNEFSIEGNILIIKVEGEEMRLKRISSFSDNTAAVVGRWRLGQKIGFVHLNGLFEIALTRDGGITQKWQSQPVKGRYKIKNSLLTTIDRTGTTKYRIRFENGGLFLKFLDEENSEEKKYTRIRR